MIEAAFAASPVFLLLFGVFIAPAYEELLFRRVLFGRLWACGRPWLGVVLSSAAFALMHEIPGTTGNSWQATGVLWLTYGVMGAAFAGVYWRTRTLWAPIARPCPEQRHSAGPAEAVRRRLKARGLTKS